MHLDRTPIKKCVRFINGGHKALGLKKGQLLFCLNFTNRNN